MHILHNQTKKPEFIAEIFQFFIFFEKYLDKQHGEC